MSIARLMARLKTAALTDLSFQMFQPVNGTPLALRAADATEERLPGMRRWVSRPALERAMTAHDEGASLYDYAAEEDRRSLLQKLLSGGVLGGVGGYKFMPNAQKSPLTATLLGVLGGSALGGGYHLLTEADRQMEASEAYHGAEQEVQKYPRTALPQQRQDESSAAAVAPTLLHTGPSVVG